MEVDANELLHRIGAVLRVISDKMDRLIEIGERVEGEVRLPFEEEAKTVANVLMNDACISSDAVADEPPKVAEPEYREPVLPGDLGKLAEFSLDGNAWTEGKLRGYEGCFWQSDFGELVEWWGYARIKKDA